MTCWKCINPIVIGGESSIGYRVVVTDKYGCVTEGKINIRVANGTNFYRPNILSIHGNVENRSFTIYSNIEEMTIADMGIYNRWGNKVFHTQNIPVNTPKLGWDGTINNRAATPGGYVYIVELIDREGKVYTLSGDVTVF